MKALPITLSLAALALSPAALAHYSSTAVYDRDTIVEAEGDIVEVSWTNPRRFVVRGAAKTWDIESNSEHRELFDCGRSRQDRRVREACRQRWPAA
jgi:hypothetical protein